MVAGADLDEHVGVAVDDDVAVALPAGLGVGDRQILSGIGDRLLGPAPQVDESIDNRLGTDVVLPHGCVEGVDVAHAQFVGNGGEVFQGENALQVVGLVLDLLGNRIAASLDGLLPAFLGEVRLDLGPGPSRGDEPQPVAARPGVRCA